MLKDVTKNRIHWPAMLLFTMAVFSAYGVITEGNLLRILQSLGFACMGYASLSMVPANLFSQRLSRLMRESREQSFQSRDVALQVVGIVCLFLDMIIRIASGDGLL